VVWAEHWGACDVLGPKNERFVNRKASPAALWNVECVGACEDEPKRQESAKSATGFRRKWSSVLPQLPSEQESTHQEHPAMGNQASTNAAATAVPSKKRPADNDNAGTKAGECKSRRTSADQSLQHSSKSARYNWPPDTLRTPEDKHPLGNVASVKDDALFGRQTNPGASIETSERGEPK
jgi:hypothetical protein